MATDENDSEGAGPLTGGPLNADPRPGLGERAHHAGEPRPAGTPAGTAASRWLALVPVTAALLVFLLMVPRATTPVDIPLPPVDGVALRAVHDDDDARAARARQARLPTGILAVGTAIRGMNRAMAARDAEAAAEGRRVLDDALRGALETDGDRALDDLRTLRAVQLEEFLGEVRKYEATGAASPELLELGGAFVDRMTDAGWITGREVLLDEPERRVAFKLVWTAMIAGDRAPGLVLSLDEQRVLYTLYLTRPHVPDSQRVSFQLMRKGAASTEECESVALKERLAAELWRADKIKKLGELDAAYPTGYALGVAYYRAGRYDLAMDAFRGWIDAHPDGPLALRARNHWKAAYVANGPG
ncbi:MAG: hypothetical protein JWP97_5573 [Labilithrix sp.]|nr:hypothetical protein [Labilithrix sp.]